MSYADEREHPSGNPLQQQRRDAIVKLIGDGAKLTHSDIVARLAEQGIHTARKTVAKDLAELGYVRISTGEYVPMVATPDEVAFAEAVDAYRMHVHAVFEVAPRLVCVQTDIGHAEGVSLALLGLKQCGWPILGCTTGIDTVLLVHKATDTSGGMVGRLRTLAGMKWDSRPPG